MSVAINGTNGITYNDGTVQASAAIGKNRIINGDMRIDQRNAGVAATVGSDYTVDRWKFQEGGSGGQVVSVQQVTDAPVGFSNSFKLTNTTASSSVTADAYNMFWQAVEGLNWSDLEWGTSDAKSVTLSFWVKASIAGNYSLAVRSSTNDRSYVTPYAISSANTWEYKTVTIAGPTSGTFNTDNTKAIQVAFTHSMGSNYTSSGNDAWQSESKLGATGTQVALSNTVNSTWQVTGVQLEVGTSATDFEHLQFGQQLQLCQRYFYSLGGAAFYEFFAHGMYINTAVVLLRAELPVKMRSAPTLSTSGTFLTKAGSSNLATASFSVDQSATQTYSFSATISGGTSTVGYAALMFANNDINARLTFSAEL